ncbi:MAG: putative DNA-binding domain-containing protein [Lysobacterales bacterium]|jgi:hypothetical protein
MDERPDGSRAGSQRLAELQDNFAGHIRDPENVPPPTGVENRRMAIYRRLFFNNIDSLLSNNFPVLRALHDDGSWRAMVRDFYAEHRCQTPLFPEIAKEFLRYLQDTRGRREGDPAFLSELAHYEWVELALSIDERELEAVPSDPAGSLLDHVPVLSPLAWPLSYRFPVHRIKPGYEPVDAPETPTHLLVYRDRCDKVRFMELNDVSRLLLYRLQNNREASGRQLLADVAATINHPDPALVQQTGERLLEDLRVRDIILGTRPD